MILLLICSNKTCKFVCFCKGSNSAHHSCDPISKLKTNLPRVVVSEELSKPLGGKDEQTENRLIGDPESLLPRQHHVDHAQVMICVLVADIDRLQTS